MKKLRRFKCGSCQTEHERMVQDNIVVIACVKCKSKAARMLAAPRYFGNTVGRSPSAK